MISEALELYVGGGLVNYCWCVGVVSHSYGGLGGAGMVVGNSMHAG